jgi:hypothetical protein
MLSRITFSKVEPKAKYTHFIEPNGDTIAIYSMGTVPEFRVGVVTDQEFPSEEQRAAIVHIACVATLEEPHVIVEFEAGTSPFDVLVPASAKIYVDPYG